MYGPELQYGLYIYSTLIYSTVVLTLSLTMDGRLGEGTIKLDRVHHTFSGSMIVTVNVSFSFDIKGTLVRDFLSPVFYIYQK